MSRQKTILFACGTGVATSTAVNAAVTEAMKKRGLTFHAQQAKATEVPGLADNVDFIVATTPISASVKKPVIKGLPSSPASARTRRWTRSRRNCANRAIPGKSVSG